MDRHLVYDNGFLISFRVFNQEPDLILGGARANAEIIIQGMALDLPW